MLRKLTMFVGVPFLGGGIALGQSTFGTLVGVVTDPTGAVVPKATVTATHLATNNSKSVSTDSSGSYELINLLPGAYNVAVRAAGFKELVQENIPLDPRATVRVNAVLQVGTTQTRVAVKGQVPVIITETGTVSNLETSQQVSQLPINTRALDASQLATIPTLPGVVVDRNGTSVEGGIGGASRSALIEYSVDGLSTVDVRNNGPTVEMYPSTEGNAEVKVTTELANAGDRSITDVAFISNGGSNREQGSLFAYLKNDAREANVGRPRASRRSSLAPTSYPILAVRRVIQLTNLGLNSLPCNRV